MNVLALVPARGGSKGVPRKNLAPVAGKPLLAWTIEAARAARRVSRTVVSTEDEEIARVARELGAEVPFRRPPELASDEAPALPVVQHALRALDAEGWRADCVAWLQPTSPLRTAAHVDAAVALLFEKQADTVVSVVPVPHRFHPLSVMRLEGERLVPWSGPDLGPLRRQDKPPVFARNGPAVLVVRAELVRRERRLYGERTLPFPMRPEDSLDVDEPRDLAQADAILSQRVAAG